VFLKIVESIFVTISQYIFVMDKENLPSNNEKTAVQNDARESKQGKSARVTKPKVDFIARNKDLAAKIVGSNVRPKTASEPSVKTKTTAKPIFRPNSAPVKRSENHEHTDGSRSRPASALARTKTRAVKTKNEDRKKPVGVVKEEEDLITKLFKRNIVQVVEDIFQYMTPEELYNCKLVCRSWRHCVRDLWTTGVSRAALKRALDYRWKTGKHTRVQMRISGYECRNNCAQNFRSCNCKPLCGVEHGRLIFQWDSKYVKGESIVNDASPQKIDHKFPREQFQVRFSLNLSLALETGTYLSSPIFLEPQIPSTSIRYRGCVISTGENKVELTIKDRTGGNRQLTPWTGRPDTATGHPRRIDGLFSSTGRLALLMEGRVFVYDLDILLCEKQSSVASLILKGTRQNEPTVLFVYLFPDRKHINHMSILLLDM